MKFSTLTVLMLAALLQAAPLAADASGGPGRIVTTTTLLADLAGRIAGEDADVTAVASPKRDLHHVTPTPRDILKVRKADVLIHHGLQAEPWLLPLLTAAGNPAFLDGTRAVDAGARIEPLEVPEGLTRLEGDLHAEGNPHYWLDPLNAALAAETIAEALGNLFPEQREVYRERAQEFRNEIERRLAGWLRRAEAWERPAVVTYHRSWSYFARRFGLEVIGELEPKPGIPPTGKHLAGLVEKMREEQAALVIREPFCERRTSEKVAREGGAAVVEMVQFPRAVKGADDYLTLMEFNLHQIEAGLERARA